MTGTPAITPEAERERRLQVIRDLCGALNRLGAEPKWTPGRLHIHINAKYYVEDGLDSLGFRELDEVKLELDAELDALIVQGPSGAPAIAAQ